MTARTGSVPTSVLRDVSIRGVRLRFLEVGLGPPVILVHGFLASHATWRAVLSPLATRFRVIAVDLPGFGASEKPPPARYAYTAEAFAESLVDLVAALDVNRVSVIGHRLGCTVALTMAVLYPDLVHRLVLVTPELYPRRRSVWERVAGVPLVGGFVFKQLTGPRLFQHYLDPWTPPVDALSARGIEWLDAFGSPAAREAAYATLRGASDTRALLARMTRATAPTLVCGGGRDDRERLAQVRRLARELPSARLELFDAGASPEEERPEPFARRVAAFLTETARG